MKCTCVVQNQIHNHSDSATVGCINQLREVLQCADLRIDSVVVKHVVLMISWRRMNWRQPNPADAQLNKVIQPLDDPPQIPEAVTVAIGEGPHKNLVKDTVLSQENVLFGQLLHQDRPERQHYQRENQQENHKSPAKTAHQTPPRNLCFLLTFISAIPSLLGQILHLEGEFR